MQKVICSHEHAVVKVSYGQGHADEVGGIEVQDLKECPDCKKTWREKHRGTYQRITEPIKIS